MNRLSRRRFVVGAGVSAATFVAGCGRLPWQAQAPEKRPRLGILNAGFPENSTTLPAFWQGLREQGLVDGENITIEYRWGEDVPARLPDLATELVDARVDVLVAMGTRAASVLSRATAGIPIVMLYVLEPVDSGLIVSLARPGGNVTGLASTPSRELVGKRLELLQGVVPGIRRVAALWNPAESGSGLADTQTAAHALDFEVLPVLVQDPTDFGRAFDAVLAQRAEALTILGGGFLTENRGLIAGFALDQKLPSIQARREFPDVGGLMAYGPNFPSIARRGAYYVDRILKGTSPADLPVEQPATFEFVVNLKTAAALGITFPQEIMLQVTEVIQ